MKFTYLTAGLLATLVSAKPILSDDTSPIDYSSGLVTAEVTPQLVTSPLTERALAKRANTQFIVYTSSGKSHPDTYEMKRFAG